MRELLLPRTVVRGNSFLPISQQQALKKMTQVPYHYYIAAYLVTVNIITFATYGIDKLKAKKGKWRISEATLLLMAVIGGSIGAWAGMKTWHHKTMHKKFTIGIPLLLFLQLALIVYLHVRA